MLNARELSYICIFIYKEDSGNGDNIFTRNTVELMIKSCLDTKKREGKKDLTSVEENRVREHLN